MTTSAWGPASIPANTPTSSPAITIPAADTFVQATADCAALASGITRTVMIQYRKSSGSAWQDYGSVSGVTVGGPDLDRHGGIVEWGVTVSPLPDPSTSGRQVRFVGTLSQAATISGHLTTG